MSIHAPNNEKLLDAINVLEVRIEEIKVST